MPKKVSYDHVKKLFNRIRDWSMYDATRSYLTNWSDGSRRYVSFGISIVDNEGRLFMMKQHSGLTTKEAYLVLDSFIKGFENALIYERFITK